MNKKQLEDCFLKEIRDGVSKLSFREVARDLFGRVDPENFTILQSECPFSIFDFHPFNKDTSVLEYIFSIDLINNHAWCSYCNFKGDLLDFLLKMDQERGYPDKFLRCWKLKDKYNLKLSKFFIDECRRIGLSRVPV